MKLNNGRITKFASNRLHAESKRLDYCIFKLTCHCSGFHCTVFWVVSYCHTFLPVGVLLQTSVTLSAAIAASFNFSTDWNLHPFKRVFILGNRGKIWSTEVVETVIPFFRLWKHSDTILQVVEKQWYLFPDTPVLWWTDKVVVCHGGTASFQIPKDDGVYGG